MLSTTSVIRSARDSARDIQPRIQPLDTDEIRRALDTVPDRVDAALEAAGVSLRDAGESLRAAVHDLSAPPQRTRMPSGRGLVAGIAFIVASIAVATWLMRRVATSRHTFTADDDMDVLDRDDLDRATSEGMGTAAGAVDRSSLMTTGEGLLSPLDQSNEMSDRRLTGVMAEPTAIAGNGLGVPASDRVSS
jgi:hypothetical protein